MPVPVSYRLDEGLKARLAERSASEAISETTLVSRLLDEGLKSAECPGIVYRDGPAGRRAALAGGPDVWEVVTSARHAGGTDEERVSRTAELLGLHERLVRLALHFAAKHADEVEARIALDEAAAEEARRLTEERRRLMAS